MKALRKPIFLAAGSYTVSLGSGRKEFHPKKPRPGIEHYIKEAGEGTLAQISNPDCIDEGVIGNFMASRYVKQAHLCALLPTIHPTLVGKPMVRVEGACGSGGLGLATGIKTVLADFADVVLVVGAEVQNSVKAVYGADILAGAGHYASERKSGHAHFFPAKFSERAGAYYEKFGTERTRRAMARWFANAVENARLNPQAQEHHNGADDLYAMGMTPPSGKVFTDHLNFYDCSKVSDGGASIIVCTKEGYESLGLSREDVVEIKGLGQAEADLTVQPDDLTSLSTSKAAAAKALGMAGVKAEDVGVFELHDCFTISGILSFEALGLAGHGEGPDLVEAGETGLKGKYPANTGGGLVGYGHPVGASGVRQAVDLWKQLTGKAGDFQLAKRPDRGLMISMGGNDKTVISMVVER